MAERKNIIILTHDFVNPLKGGGGLRTLKIASEFKKRGHSVIIVAPATDIFYLGGMRVYSIYPPRKQYSQILSSFKFNIRLFVKLLWRIRKTDLVVAHNTIAAATLPILKKALKFKFVLDITDLHAEYLLVGKRNILEKVLTSFLLRYEYYIIKSADAITVATSVMKKVLCSKGVKNHKIRIVYDGVDKKNVPRYKENGSDYGIIHLGAIDKQHGVEVFIQAMPYILKEIPSAKFYLVGGGRELNKIRDLAFRMNVIRNCVFTDILSQTEARRVLKKATIGVIPRRDNLPNRVVTTLKIYEYWASGTAVVSTMLEGIEEIAEGNINILWFRSGDSKDLAGQIVTLFKNSALKEKIIQGGLQAVEKFNISVSASKIVDFALK